MMDKEEKKKGERESEKGGHVPQGMSRKTHIHQQTCGELTDPNFLLIKTTCQELCSEVEVNADAKKKTTLPKKTVSQKEENKRLKIYTRQSLSPCSPSARSSWRRTPWCRALGPGPWWSRFSPCLPDQLGLRSWSDGGTGSVWCSICDGHTHKHVHTISIWQI